MLLGIVSWLLWLRPVGDRIGPRPAPLDDGWAVSAPAAEGFNDAALTAAARSVLDAPFDVHAIVVERHGRLVAEYYQGGADRSVYSLISVRRSFGPADLHDVRSIGKSVTGLLYGIALANGEVPAPERPVAAAFPALAGRAAHNARRIHIENLLDMDSGLTWSEGESLVNDELRMFWVHDLPAYVLARPLSTAPGTTFNYNGGGTAVLAQIIEQGTHLPIDRFAEQRLFQPMGIRDWEWVTDVHGRPMPFNGLRLRPRDLLKIGRLVLDHGRWNGMQLVPSQWIDVSLAPGLATGVVDFRYHHQWWSGTVTWKGRQLPWYAAFGNGGQRLFVVPALDLAMATTAGAYGEEPTAIAVNRLLQSVVSSVGN